MTTLEHFTWIENNVINYNKMNNIVKQHHNGITTKNLVTIYNFKEETKEETNKKQTEQLTIETFNHIVKTIQRHKNTFNNILNIVYNEETTKWLMKDENHNATYDELSRLKKENKKLKAELDKLTTTIFEDY
jgi:hypothetical protein